MAGMKLYLRDAITPGASDIFYLSRADGVTDGKVAATDLEPVFFGLLSGANRFAAYSHGHGAGDISGLAAVATSGAYNDLTGKPSLATVATTGSYSDLTGKPTLGTSAALNVDTDGTAAANSDTRVPSQKAMVSYVAAHGGGTSDGNKGDITVSGTGTVWDINAGAVGTAELAADAVTYAKLQNVSATSRILGRKTASAGDAEECTLSEILDFVGSAAQGDLLYRNASGWVRLGAGTSGQVLQTQGASANPQWATPTMTLIQRITTTGGQTSIDFTSIPGTYKNLRIVGNLRGSSTGTVVLMRFNNDTSNSNYNSMQFQNAAGSLSGASFTAGNSIAALTFDQPPSSASAGIAASVVAEIPNYASTSFNKGAVAQSGYGTVYKAVEMNWASTAAITRVTLVESGGQAFANGLEVSLYGIS